MKRTVVAIGLLLILGAFTAAQAQQPPQPGRGPMGPGMMKGTPHQMTGLMKDIGSMVARTSSPLVASS